jgi:hypothetical protein
MRDMALSLDSEPSPIPYDLVLKRRTQKGGTDIATLIKDQMM